ncbi:MAG: DUF4270 domain-containing protein [Flavobacterium sp.]
MQKNFFKLVFLFSIISIISCDSDYSTIGSEVIGDNHFDFTLNDESTIVAYTEKTNAVQSNGFPINPFGIYNNPNFGITKAHFVSQVLLDRVDPPFENLASITVDSVKLNVPYFRRIISIDADGARTFELDSLYGGEAKFSLKVYENGYFLRNFDPNTENFGTQKYFTDDFTLIDNAKLGLPLNDDLNVAQNSQFFFSKKEIIETKVNTEDPENPTITRIVPGISLKLNKDFFQQKLFNPATTSQLFNNSNFVNHFRGLFFKVEEIDGSTGSLNMINFKDGDITVYYKETVTLDDDNNSSTPEVTKIVDKTMVLSLGGNSISLIEQNNSTEYNTALENQNTEQGDPLLWLKGNQGSMAVIKLFGRNDDDSNNGITPELEEIKANNWQINEANLTFVINREELLGSAEPVRVFLYDIANKRALVDYTFDLSTNPSKPKLNKFIHGGIIERELTSGGRGVRYKVRITNHIRNIVRNDSTNVRLGLIVTEDIAGSNLLAASLRNPSANNVKSVPAAAVMNPLGTIIYGTDPSIPDENRLKLNIYFTKPN